MQENNNTADFDFEFWASLAKNDPERFESMRKKELKELIDKAPDRIKHRMEGLQWQIDQLRERAANPLSGCLRISQMMWNSVTGERGLLEALETPEKLISSKTKTDSHNIIPLKKDK